MSSTVLNITDIIASIVSAIGSVFGMLQSTVVRIGTVQFSLADLGIGALAFAVLICIIFPRNADSEGVEED